MHHPAAMRVFAAGRFDCSFGGETGSEKSVGAAKMSFRADGSAPVCDTWIVISHLTWRSMLVVSVPFWALAMGPVIIM